MYHLTSSLVCMQNVIDAARTLDKVADLNMAVCEPFYQGIIRRLWAEKSVPCA